MALRRPLAAIPLLLAVLAATHTGLALIAGGSALHAARATHSTAAARSAYAGLPMSFEPAAPGSPARYIAHGAGYSLFLTDHGSLLTLSRGAKRAPAVLRTTLAGASPTRPRAEGR